MADNDKITQAILNKTIQDNTKALDRINTRLDEYDREIHELDKVQAAQEKDIENQGDHIDKLDKRVNAWGGANTLGVLVASILAYLGLERSHINFMSRTNAIVVSDTHINSRVGLCTPLVNLDEGGSYRSSPTQRAIWKAWLDFWQEMERLDGRKILIINGDLGELDDKNRNNQLITRNKATVLEMVLDTLQPALDVVDESIIIRGTPAHVGKGAWLEEAIANDLDNAIHDTDSASWWHFRGRIEGVRFDLAHHGPMGRLPWTEKHAGIKVATMITARYAEMGAPVPDIAIRSHNHRRSDSGRNFFSVLLSCVQRISSAFLIRALTTGLTSRARHQEASLTLPTTSFFVL